MIDSSKKNFPLAYPLAFTLILSVCLIYLIGFINFSPFPGFVFDTNTGADIKVFDPNQADVFQPEDVITAINDLTIEDYRSDLKATFWDGVQVGDLASISIIRDGDTQIINWRISGRTHGEFDHRFLIHWPLAAGFLILSIGIFSTVDPNNPLWKLMSVTYLIFALWIILAIGPADQHLWLSAYLLRVIGWILVPMLIHIHLIFPHPFKNLPKWIDRFGLSLVYLLCVTGIAFDLLMPELMLYEIGLISAFSVSVILLGLHYSLQEANRSRFHLMIKFALLAILPKLIIAMLKGLNVYLGNHADFAAILAYPIISAGYLFAIWHGTLTRHHHKANRLLASYIYIVLIILLSLSIIDLLEYSIEEISDFQTIGLIAIIGLISSLGFGTFERFIDKYIIGIPVEVPQVLQSYTNILESTQDTASISSLMGSLILPALRIRQSVLIEIQSEQLIRVLDMTGVVEKQLPNADEIHQLVNQRKRIIPPQNLRNLIPQKRWIRVVLPLCFDQELIGVWLLGRRDPNDIYEAPIVQALETIAQQTSMAIIHHQKSIRLRSLFEANINRHEAERASLARELHDDTLNNLALLQREFKDPNLVGSLHSIINSLRKMIQGLRPEMLSYGLVTALQDLADILNERKAGPRVEVDLEGAPIALHRNTELHIFRIVQQACENAQEHAEAITIKIEGKIEENSILLRVIDDGKGIGEGMPLNLTRLIEEQHFGLAGMFERANIIDAKLNVESSTDAGTTITLHWTKQD
jgi:signal transduction histidine kinase